VVVGAGRRPERLPLGHRPAADEPRPSRSGTTDAITTRWPDCYSCSTGPWNKIVVAPRLQDPGAVRSEASGKAPDSPARLSFVTPQDAYATFMTPEWSDSLQRSCMPASNALALDVVGLGALNLDYIAGASGLSEKLEDLVRENTARFE
jgi:hypothetical protein